MAEKPTFDPSQYIDKPTYAEMSGKLTGEQVRMIADARIKNRTTIQQAEKADAQEAKRDAQASIDAFSRGLLSPQTPESGALEPQVIPTSKVLASQFTTDPDQGKQDLLAASLAPDSRIKKIDAGKVPAFNGLPSPSLSIADTPSVDPKLETGSLAQMGTMPKIEITKGTETPKLDAFVQALASPTAQSNADISEQYKAIEQECSTPEGLTKFQNAINKQFGSQIQILPGSVKDTEFRWLTFEGTENGKKISYNIALDSQSKITKSGGVLGFFQQVKEETIHSYSLQRYEQADDVLFSKSITLTLDGKTPVSVRASSETQNSTPVKIELNGSVWTFTGQVSDTVRFYQDLNGNMKYLDLSSNGGKQYSLREVRKPLDPVRL